MATHWRLTTRKTIPDRNGTLKGLPNKNYEGKLIIIYDEIDNVMIAGRYSNEYPQGIFDSHEEFVPFVAGMYWKDAPNKPTEKERKLNENYRTVRPDH